MTPALTMARPGALAPLAALLAMLLLCGGPASAAGAHGIGIATAHILVCSHSVVAVDSSADAAFTQLRPIGRPYRAEDCTKPVTPSCLHYGTKLV